MERLQTLVDGLLVPGDGPDAVRSAVVSLARAGQGIVAEAASGIARADSGAPMRPESQFHIASVAKPMTAVLIFQAAEEGRLGTSGIDARLIDTGLFPADIVRRLHRIDGVSHGAAITLRHLLTHTSGLRDAQNDDGDVTADAFGVPAPNSIVGRRAADFARHLALHARGEKLPPDLLTLKTWQPWDPARPEDPLAGLVNFYLSSGTMGEHALFPPGYGFHYSDTGFTILALLAERLLGASYHRLLRTRIWDRLGMADTYFAHASDLDPTPWIRAESDCWAGNVPLVSIGCSLSNDWGGGGVVATAADLNRFMIGLLEGRLFANLATLETMLTLSRPRGLYPRYDAVGHGVFTYATPAGRILIGHSGVWGGRMLADRQSGLFLAGTLNRLGARNAWAAEILDAVADS